MRRRPLTPLAGQRLAVLLLGAVLVACTVGPDFHPTAVQSPAAWGPEPADVPSRTDAGPVGTRWWKSFHDRELTTLVDRVATQNLDLKTAAERVLQGVQQRRIAAAQGLPQINDQNIYTRNRQSPTGFVSLVTPRPGAPLEYDLFQQGLTSSWELDLFGRVRRAVEAADADILASVEARHDVAIASIAELAQDYMQLRGAQARIAITERNLSLARDNTRLVRTRFSNGVATTLDLAQAQAQEATIAATLPPLRAQEASLINAIGFLLGEQPRALEAELRSRGRQPGVPPVVPVGLPGTVVRRRPDVREAEARLHSATAQTGVAVADFYPDVTLNGDFNLQGLRFANVFSLPSRAFEVGPTITIPVFQGGRLRATLRLRQSQQREAAISFQRTVLQAWQEVDNALTAYAEAQRRRAQVSEAVKQNAIALGAARQRYSEGVADFLNVITTQAQLLQTETDLAASDTEIETDLVTLYRALGGGWDVVDYPWAVTPLRSQQPGGAERRAERQADERAHPRQQ